VKLHRHPPAPLPDGLMRVKMPVLAIVYALRLGFESVHWTWLGELARHMSTY